MARAYLTPSQTRAALAEYTPIRLDPDLWASIRDDAIGVVAKAQPTDIEHANKLIQTLVGFLADQDDAHKGVKAVLTEQRLNSWLYASLPFYTKGTLQGMAHRLRRLQRAARGQRPPARMRGRSTARKPATRPMTVSELGEVTGDLPLEWMAANGRHPKFMQVRLTVDVQTLNDYGLVAAVRAGIGRARLDAAAPYVQRPDNLKALLRGE